MKLKKNQVQKKKSKDQLIKEAKSIVYNKDFVKIKHCIERKLTIYPACQTNGKIALFVQYKDKFWRLNDVLYSQDTDDDCFLYTAEIIKGYYEYYEKRKRN